MLFVTLDPTTFGLRVNRSLYRALRRLEWPAARADLTRDRHGAHVHRWHVDGLIGALGPERATNANVAADRLYRALDDAPLLPFGDRMLDRHRELHRRRTFYASVERRILDADLALPTRHRIDTLLADYAAEHPRADVEPLEVELEGLIP
jgi:hypothetical protein